MSDDRARRVGLNESLFRQVNEEIEAINRTFSDIGTMSVICECGETGCSTQLEISVDEYERIRSNPTHFVVVPGHEIPDLETVVERGRGYDVVEKDLGTPSKVARDTDPRS